MGIKCVVGTTSLTEWDSKPSADDNNSHKYQDADAFTTVKVRGRTRENQPRADSPTQGTLRSGGGEKPLQHFELRLQTQSFPHAVDQFRTTELVNQISSIDTMKLCN
jgi:hypothetical protein